MEERENEWRYLWRACRSRSRSRCLRRCLHKVDSFRKASDNNLHGLPYAKCLSLAVRTLPTMGGAARHTSHPFSLHYLSLFTSLLRFVPTVGVVFVLCMRAVTCKNGRRRAYFGSWLHLDSPFPSPFSFATPCHPHSFVAFLVVAEGERVALRPAHVAYNFIHHTSKKRKKHTTPLRI